VAPRDRKREGDRRTPSGVFALGAAFGAGPDPGVRVGWLHADGADVWVDDPASPLYNTRQRLPSRGRWRSAERLAVPAYRFAQVIGYNSRRVPGRGSAIFLHVDRGRATSGCVALPRAALVRLLRWQEPGAVIVIDRAVRR
jgi:L,D-peptidoglycan transpeptidase YkuD (ErfK/YbiS/YcfS/YnhG family)